MAVQLVRPGACRCRQPFLPLARGVRQRQRGAASQPVWRSPLKAADALQ